jgi:hypothetical protein
VRMTGRRMGLGVVMFSMVVFGVAVFGMRMFRAAHHRVLECACCQVNTL